MSTKTFICAFLGAFFFTLSFICACGNDGAVSCIGCVVCALAALVCTSMCDDANDRIE